MLFGSWDVLTCVSTSKVPTPEKVPTRADTSTCRHVPTPLGADTCRHLWYQSYELYLDTGMCWQMPAPGKVPTPRKVPTRAGMCQHIKVPAKVSTHLGADTCWHMNVIWKLGCADMCQHLEGADTWEGADTSTCRHVPTPLGADTCDISHMNFTWILGCAGKCQHLEKKSIWLVSGMSARVGT